MIVTAKDLRFKISELFNALSKKEEIIITYRGKAKAKLVGLDEPSDKDDVAFGMWRDRDEDVNTMVRKMRKGRNFDL